MPMRQGKSAHCSWVLEMNLLNSFKHYNIIITNMGTGHIFHMMLTLPQKYNDYQTKDQANTKT